VDVVLNEQEMEALFRQDPATKNNGGWQRLNVGLQERCNRATGELHLTPDDLRRIPKYAFDYEDGGWERRLIAAFGRHLGPNLGR
jgi:hypothetical protein